MKTQTIVDRSLRFQHIYRCPQCYIKLTYWPTEEMPCAACGFPKEKERGRETT